MEETGPVVRQKETLTMLIHEPDVEYYDEMERRLQEKFPDYEIESLEWNLDCVEKQVKTTIVKGNSIELVKWFPNQMDSFLGSQMVMDLTPYVDEDWKSIWEEWALDLGIYDGKLYALPSVVVYPVLEVNEELMEELGIPVKDNWTWDEFAVVCRQIKESSHVFPFGISSSRVCWFMRNASMQVWDSKEEMEAFQRGEIPVSDSRFCQALKKINELFVENYSYPGDGAFSQDKEQLEKAFEQGKIAMLFNVNNGVLESRERMLQAGWKKLRVVQFPDMGSEKCDYLLGGCEGYFIPKSTEHPEEAVQILKELTGKPMLSMLQAKGEAVPLKDSGEESAMMERVYPQELMNLSYKLYDYINYRFALEYYANPEKTMETLEDLRLEAINGQ